MPKVAKILDGFTIVLFVALIILASLQILFRYVLRYPLPWTEEMARFVLVWVTFLGAASACRRKLHLAVDFFIKKLNLETTRIVSLIFYFLILLFLGIILYGALIMMVETKPIFAGSIPWLSMMFLYLGPLIGLIFMIIFILGQVFQAARELKNSGEI